MKKISSKIITLVLVCAISMSILVGGTSIYKSISTVSEESQNSLLYLAESNAGKFNEDLVVFESIVDGLDQIVKGTIEFSRMYEPGYLEEYSANTLSPIVKGLVYKIDKATGISINFDHKYTGKSEGVWFAIDNDNTLVQFPITNIAGKAKDDPSVSFYYNTINLGKASWTDLYLNSKDINVMTYSLPIVINGETVGRIGMDLRVKQLVNDVENVKIYDTGYAFMLSSDYDFLIHSELTAEDNLRELNDGMYADVVAQMDANESGVIKTEFNGVRQFISYSKLNDGKIIVLAAPLMEVYASLFETAYLIVGVIVFASILSIIIAITVGNKISRPIVTVTGILEKTAQLDLTNIDETKEMLAIEKSKDEVGAIYKATGVLRAEMKKIIKDIEDSTNKVVNTVLDVNTATQETSQAIGDMAKTVEELATAAMGQAEDAEIGSSKLYTLTNEIKTAVENGSIVVENSNRAKNLNVVSSEAMGKMVDSLTITNKSAGAVGENIQSLLEKSQSIGNILNTITGIAEQTNLLALNASIEAARAGEAGRGFAVVADEIRKLSEQTGNATKTIAEIIKVITNEVDQTKHSMDESQVALAEANGSLDLVKSSFKDIFEAIDGSIGAINILGKNLENIDNHKEEVVLSIQSISSVTEETAASTEELSASMEEQTATMETIAKSTEELKQITEVLNSLVNKFKL